ncbi:DUF6514 family protein [Oscillospiraceae bacterium WX1]
MEICQKLLSFEEKPAQTLVYFITIEDTADKDDGICCENYGVGVTVAESGETALVSNVTFSQTDILILADLLASHLVTPTTMQDVISDWLCS